jgi:hypothetical protein
MKRTLLAVGVAVLASMMLVPFDREQLVSLSAPTLYTVTIMRPFFFLIDCHSCSVHWTLFALQTAFAAVAAAVIVNLFPHRSRR